MKEGPQRLNNLIAQEASSFEKSPQHDLPRHVPSEVEVTTSDSKPSDEARKAAHAAYHNAERKAAAAK